MTKGGPAGIVIYPLLILTIYYKIIQCSISLKSECIIKKKSECLKGHYKDKINNIHNMENSVRQGTQGFFNNKL